MAGHWIGHQRLALDLGLVNRGTAKKARLLVGVVLDHLQRETNGLVAATSELEQETVRVVELGAPVWRRREFLDIGAAEVAGLNGGTQLGESRFNAARIEVLVEQQAHGRV